MALPRLIQSLGQIRTSSDGVLEQAMGGVESSNRIGVAATADIPHLVERGIQHFATGKASDANQPQRFLDWVAVTVDLFADFRRQRRLRELASLNTERFLKMTGRLG